MRIIIFIKIQNSRIFQVEEGKIGNRCKLNTKKKEEKKGTNTTIDKLHEFKRVSHFERNSILFFFSF